MGPPAASPGKFLDFKSSGNAISAILRQFFFIKILQSYVKTCKFSLILEIVITRAAPAFHKLFMVMGCVFDTNTVHKTVEKLTFQAFY